MNNEYRKEYKTSDPGWYTPLNPALSGKNENNVIFTKDREDIQLPEYKHKHDSGVDLRSSGFYNIPPGEVKVICTGLRMQMPNGLEAQIRPRSGLAAKYFVTVLNSPGTIDAGYTGEIMVILINHGKKDFVVEKGYRIAQMVFATVEHPNIVGTNKTLDKTPRGDAGFGSTGIK